MKERSAYNPPRVISTPGGRNIFVTFSAYHMMGFDVEDGELLWTHEQDNFPPDKRKPGYGDTHANTILYKDGYIYYTEGDGNCCVKLSLSDDGTEIQQIWRNKDFDSYMGGFIKIGSYLYGSGTAKPQLLSLYSDTGVISDSLEIGRGTIIAVDNKIYYYTQRGTVYLVDYNNGSLKTMASFKINKGSREHFSHPLIHKGVLYIRHGNAIMGYSIKKDQV
jgi:outer membrane protein assembly factor BamB